MKKLFIAALGALMALSMAACGGSARKPESFSDEVVSDGNTYGMTGPNCAYINGQKITKDWGNADGSLGLATAVSLREIAQRDVKVATQLEKNGVKGLYKVDKVELGHQALAGYMKGAYNEKGEYVEKDGVYTVKFVLYGVDEETEKKVIDTWIPSPEAYSESLTPATFWAPIHQEAKDEHGLAHDSDSVNLAGAGEYTYYLAVYKKAVKGSFYGIAVFQDKALSEYVAPAGMPDYCLVGDWQGWENNKEASGVNAGESLTVTVAAGNQGRFVEFGSWTTKAGFSDVTTGANLVEEGGDNNFKFLAAGTYTVTLAASGNAVTIVAA